MTSTLGRRHGTTYEQSLFCSFGNQKRAPVGSKKEAFYQSSNPECCSPQTEARKK
jgi:hypothetical protein